jgi:predicted RNA binding protein YcfA (HicA-like mRNA interferase family)
MLPRWNSWGSSKFPYDPVSPPQGKELIRILQRWGFEVMRSRGSHFLLRHPDGRTTTVPVHSGETLGPGLLRSILRDVELSAEDLVSRA